MIRVRLATSIWYGTLMKNCFKDWSQSRWRPEFWWHLKALAYMNHFGYHWIFGMLLFSSEIRLPCKKPIDITNGSYTVWGNNMLLEYTCDAGLFALGRTFGSCNPVTRRWSIKPIKCVGKLSMISPNYTNNTTKWMCTGFKNFSWLSITRFRITWNKVVIHLTNW